MARRSKQVEGANCSALQIGSTPSAHLLSLMKAIVCEAGGRAPPEQNTRSTIVLVPMAENGLILPQNLVGLPEFAVLALKLLDERLFSAGRPWPFAAIKLDLTGPERIGYPANNPICPQSPSVPEFWLADVPDRIVSGATPINRLDTLLPCTWKA